LFLSGCEGRGWLARGVSATRPYRRCYPERAELGSRIG
jgi:hypothetical protein